jgi:hypothetical protein
MTCLILIVILMTAAGYADSRMVVTDGKAMEETQ